MVLTGISDSEILTFTDQSTGQTSSVSLGSGEDIDAIVSKINSELSEQFNYLDRREMNFEDYQNGEQLELF